MFIVGQKIVSKSDHFCVGDEPDDAQFVVGKEYSIIRIVSRKGKQNEVIQDEVFVKDEKGELYSFFTKERWGFYIWNYFYTQAELRSLKISKLNKV